MLVTVSASPIVCSQFSCCLRPQWNKSVSYFDRFIFYCCVCSDCSWFGFGFRFLGFGHGTWAWAWAPEKVLQHFSTVHCFVLLCRTGLLELSSACICISEHVSVPLSLPLAVSMLSLALCWHWKLVPSVCAIATPPVTLHIVSNSKHFGRVNIPRNYNKIWGSTTGLCSVPFR